MMASVYDGADVVIAASVASGSNDGFLRERIPYREGTVTIGTDPKFTGNAYNYRLVVDPLLRKPVNPLSRRAWAYQEHVCGRRYLGFEHGELVWDCCQISDCESDWVTTSTTSDFTRACCFDMLVRNKPAGTIHELWRTSVRKYCLLGLTFMGDKIVALSAVASRFQSVLDSTYLACLWKEDLIRGLMWSYVEPATPHPFYEPSWSWVSIDNLYLNWEREFPATIYEAEVLDASVSVSTSNQFGPVDSGTIKLRTLTNVTKLRHASRIH